MEHVRAATRGRRPPRGAASGPGPGRGVGMPLTVRELVDDPDLGLEVVGGTQGTLDTPIRWAHISDTPDPTPWLEGGEILLTTGLGVRDDPGAQDRLVRGLRDRGAVAIGFGVGVSLPDVPPAMADAADAVAIPLFTVPFEVPFIAVTRRVAQAVFDEHFATLRSAIDLHRRVLGSVIAGEGIRSVLSSAAALLPDVGFLVFDFAGRLLAKHGATDTVHPAHLWPALAPRHAERDRATVAIGTATVSSVAVRGGEAVQAVLAVVAPRPLLEHEQLLVEQVLAGISLDLARRQSVREGRRGRVDELIEEVAAGRAGSQMVARVLGRLGADPALPYRVLCLRYPASVPEPQLCTITEDVLAAHGSPAVIGRYDGDVFAIVPTVADEIAGVLADALAERGWREVAVGRSAAKDTLEQMAAAVREARTAAHAPPHTGGVRDVEAIGLQGLLASLRDGVEAATFVHQVIGALMEYDERESTQLVPSLRAYLRRGCRPGPAADDLRVHRHTLGYRLDRIAELTGRDPRDGANLLDFSLALALADGELT